MKIELITPENHSKLLEIYKNTPALFLQNNGYEYIKKDTLTDEDKAKLKEVEVILKDSIEGFQSFTNFRLSKKEQDIEIRLQYRYDASFTGVGYILLDELLKGFRN
jgi:CRISPR/Cas system-associated protein Cas7 (RAMP superfamily)